MIIIINKTVHHLRGCAVRFMGMIEASFLRLKKMIHH